MVTEGSYVCGEHNIVYVFESLCRTPEINENLCQLFSNFKKWKKITYYGLRNHIKDTLAQSSENAENSIHTTIQYCWKC